MNTMPRYINQAHQDQSATSGAISVIIGSAPSIGLPTGPFNDSLSQFKVPARP
jgi:hypothetical protein